MLHQYKTLTVYQRIRAFARELRKKATPAEKLFWEKVRDRRLFDLKINRQFILVCHIDERTTKYYIADFYCHEHKLIIELDGGIHLEQVEEDLVRTEVVQALGYTVIRFKNEDVLFTWDIVEATIKSFIQKS